MTGTPTATADGRSPARSSAWAGFLQVAYVTNDPGQATRAWSGQYGVRDFARIDGVHVDADNGDGLDLSVALAWVGELMVEVIEPAGGADAIYRDPVRDRPGFVMAMHHVGFAVDSPDALVERQAALSAAGHPIALSAVRPDSAFFFYAYADARPTLGHYIECMTLTPSRRGLFATLPRF